MTTVPDEYMTVIEFASLPSDVHHAVWKAYAERSIDAVPAHPSTTGTVYRYRRDQVLEIARELESSRG